MADVNDLNRLAIDLAAAPKEAWEGIGKAVEGSSLDIKKDWNQRLSAATSGPSFQHIGGTVDYTMSVGGASLAMYAISGGMGGSRIESEIGPNLGRSQGAFAGWFEEGQANIPALHPGAESLKAEEPNFEFWVADAVEKALRKAGL